LYSRATGSQAARDDPFALHLSKDDQLKTMYLDAEHEDGYYRDQSVFGDGISVEDTMGVIVRYRTGAILTYSLTAYAPWGGFRLVFNGSKGRIEMNAVEQSYEGAVDVISIKVFPMFSAPYDVSIDHVSSNAGGDRVLLNDLFGTPAPDRFNRAASHVDLSRS
jgi:hypothetical protein